MTSAETPDNHGNDNKANKAFDPDDPTLTAYILGELEDDERVAFEARIKDSPEGQQMINDFRAIAGDLGRELSKEPCPELSDAQRQAIDAAASSSGSGKIIEAPFWRRRAFTIGSITGMAACALVMVFLSVERSTVQENERELARVETKLAIPIAAGPERATREIAPPDGAAASKESNPTAIPSRRALESVAPAPVREVVVGKLEKRDGLDDVEAASEPPSIQDVSTALSGPRRQRFFQVLKSGDEATSQTRADSSPVEESAVSVAAPAPTTPGLVGASQGNERAKAAIGEDLRRRIDARSTPLDEAETVVPGGFFRREDIRNEDYEAITENPFVAVADDPLSTFSIDVDTASYANVRRFLNQNTLPPANAVRIEELVNYFGYRDPLPMGAHPFSVTTEVAECLWNGKNRLVRIGLRGKEVGLDDRPLSNLVFLTDVSGSMNQPNKLPLLKRSLKKLVEKLGENDRVAIVAYAAGTGLVLPSTTGDHKETIFTALENLQSSGGTHGSAGIQLAYDTAIQNFIKGGVNRVILATDGDFNVGITNRNDLVELIKTKAKSGVFLSVLGFGTGNIKDATMEQLADNGNGNYSYIDSDAEGHKVLVEEMGATLVTVAKDVKIQVEFNPAVVASHRLVGYENRKLEHHEFNDDTRDAGEIGAGHSVTALYEIVPVASATAVAAVEKKKVDRLRYQRGKAAAAPELTEASRLGELLHVKLRYKDPDGSESKLLEVSVSDRGLKYGQASEDFKFAASVAAFGMLLRESKHSGNASFNAVLELAGEGKGEDKSGRRSAFLELVRKAKAISETR